MSSSQNLQLYPSSIQLPRLFPNQAYQPLPDPPQNTEPISQSTRSENLAHNPNYAQNNIVRSNVPNFDQARDAEAEFKRSFDRFYKKYCSNQGFTLMFFFILILNMQEKGLATILLIGFAVVYLVQVASALCRAETLIDTFRLSYKMFEFFGVSVYIVWNPFESSPSAANLLMACLLMNYLLKTVLAYYSNRAQYVRFVNQVNKTILGIRACIFLQGIPMIFLSYYNDIKITNNMIKVLLTPYFVIILMLVLFTVKFVRHIYFVHKAAFWESAASEKETGLRWILGNLFGMISLFLLQTYLILFDEGQSEVLVFVAIVTWCAISLLFSEYCHDGVFKVCETLAIIVQNQGRAQVGNVATEDIKYVIKISNTYFRPATLQEMDRFNNKPGSAIEVSNEGDLEAGAEANTDEEKLKCIVCCRKSANAVFMGCGHGGICFSCAKKINKQQQKECHMCRQRISSLLKLNIKNNKENVYEIICEMKSHEQRGLSWYA